MFTTVISGVLVFVCSQFISEFYIKSKERYNNLIGKIGFTLANRACYYANPLDMSGNPTEDKKLFYKEISGEAREMAAEINAFVSTRPKYMRHRISNDEFMDIKSSFIGISNRLFFQAGIYGGDYGVHNGNEIENIKRLLGKNVR